MGIDTLTAMGAKFNFYYAYFWASQVALVVKNLPAHAGDIEIRVQSLEEGMEIHSSTLAGETHGQRSQAATVHRVTKRVRPNAVT